MLISEDVITALARFSPDLRLIIIQYAPELEWDQHVTGMRRRRWMLGFGGWETGRGKGWTAVES